MCEIGTKLISPAQAMNAALHIPADIRMCALFVPTAQGEIGLRFQFVHAYPIYNNFYLTFLFR